MDPCWTARQANDRDKAFWCSFAQYWAAPLKTAACTARAIRAPHGERGPVKSSGRAPPAAEALAARALFPVVPATRGMAVGAATQIASEAVPVPAKPASMTACDLASVAVITAFT